MNFREGHSWYNVHTITKLGGRIKCGPQKFRTRIRTRLAVAAVVNMNDSKAFESTILNGSTTFTHEQRDAPRNKRIGTELPLARPRPGVGVTSGRGKPFESLVREIARVGQLHVSNK